MPRPTSYAVFCLKKNKQICRHRLRRQYVGYITFSHPQSLFSLCVLPPYPILFPYTTLFRSNIINGVERPVKAAELFAFTLRVRAGNTDVLTDAEENVRQKLRAEGVM